MRIQILGCGSSAGIPLATGFWGRCDEKNPKNRRMRASVVFYTKGQTWLIDAGPDLRTQCLAYGISKIDGVLITHGHFDHIGGLEELRPFSVAQKAPIDVWVDEKTLNYIQKRLAYALVSNEKEHTGAFIQPKPLADYLEISGTPVHVFTQNHGYSTSLGFRFPSWAYSTDVWALDPTALTYLQNLELWIVGCVSFSPNSTHVHLERVLQWVDILKPKRVILTHMGLEMDYDHLCGMLPKGLEPAYDGLILDV